MKPTLYSFWRSSAAFRVRIALNLKGIEYEVIPVHLRKGGGEQLQESYQALNPNGLVPQVFNAFDAKISFSGYPTLHRITQNCMQLPAFINASWEHQVDAEGKNPEPS
ncbi:MAG: hypothetical protein EBX98_01110 [Burkholderiaceae bacterium]|nr:hypothetical protein [Burkholderiaceae bacterium]